MPIPYNHLGGLSIKEKFITRKELPMEEAVKAAAEQNWSRDVRLELLEESEKEKHFSLYMEEAKVMMETRGQNYIPEIPDTEHICLAK